MRLPYRYANGGQWLCEPRCFRYVGSKTIPVVPVVSVANNCGNLGTDGIELYRVTVVEQWSDHGFDYRIGCGSTL